MSINSIDGKNLIEPVRLPPGVNQEAGELSFYLEGVTVVKWPAGSLSVSLSLEDVHLLPVLSPKLIDDVFHLSVICTWMKCFQNIDKRMLRRFVKLQVCVPHSHRVLCRYLSTFVSKKFLFFQV